MEQSKRSKTKCADLDELSKWQRKRTAMFTEQEQESAFPFHPQ